MSGIKGMRRYPPEVKEKIISEYEKGASVKSLSKKYEISRYSIQCWCGLAKDKEVLSIPKRRGRPRKTPMTTEHEKDLRIKELEREVELYKSFLRAAGRM